ncbi:SRPBCC domain-containing protein [Roseibium sp. MMSF_3544]|uniref:SRPBCC family protein n=1 Tax=unclassified Roseibium TaxID=2629323 RepID=UPI00273E1BC0|nr:SRPBCC domain-containing protein [Roseibium sp. MMSF_3544]
MNDLSVVVSRKFAAPAERVFEAWLNPETLSKFMTPGPGMTVPKASADPKVGGRFEIIMQAGDQQIPHAGTYKEISRHTRLAFTWESPFSEPDSIVTLDFVEVDGGTELTLTHVKFPSKESRNNHEGGWTRIVECLGPVVEGELAA